ncbi:MAG: POTRA domain-containing protein, partial [Pseudomonadales bacterium]
MLGGLVSALPSFAAIPAIPGVPVVDQALIRQQERERAQQEQRQPAAPDVRLERPRAAEAGRLPDGENPCFVIRRIVLDGEMAGAFRRALAAADPAADPASGRCLRDAGINLVMKRVQDAIVAQGYVTTQVRVAQQDLGSGTLALTVVPGRVRAVRFSEDSSPRATRWNALPVRAGDVLNLRDIEQGLENFKRVPTADADIRIEPVDEIGAAPGDSDLLISWRQNMPFR